MIKDPSNLKDTRFIMTILVILCITFLAAIGKIESKDFQAMVTLILAFYAGAKAIFKKRNK